LKEQHSAEDRRLKNGKIDNRKIAESQAEGYYPLSLATNSPLIQKVFLSESTADCTEGREMKSGDKFCSRSALFAVRFLLQHNENSRKFPLKDMLLMDTMNSHTKRQAEEEKRRENEMLVKHEFSAKTDAIACARYVALKKTKKNCCCPLCRFFCKTLFTSN
jgi:hypothetical protein